MSTHDFSIANQAALAAREDINDALQALASNSSSATAPASPFEKMWWYDTSNNILKSYKGSGAWINVGRFNQTSNEFEILDDTKVVTTSGTSAGLLGDQSTGTWTTGTGTTESLVSPAKVKAAIDQFAPPSQSTAAYAVGTYALAGDYGTGLHDVGDTVAGNTLFSWELYSSSDLRSGTTSATAPATAEGQAQTSFTGTWRWMSAGIQAGTRSRLGLVVRIS